MQWGPSLQVLQQFQKTTGQTPPALASMPKLKPECKPYLDAFRVLSAARGSNGFGLNPITVGEIKDYALMEGLTREEALKVLRMVQALDNAFLSYLADKNKTSQRG